VKCGGDGLEYSRRILQYVVVPETQHPKSLAAKITIPLPVGHAVGMLTPVSLDDQRSFEAGEIDDVRPNDMLEPEPERSHPPIA
jgi:hypothetical protein